MYWTIISVVLGGVLAAASGILTACLQHRHERITLMHAFAGEIRAVLAIIRRRNYLDYIDQLLAATRRGDPLNAKRITGNQSYFRIYEANAGRIGVLPGGQAGDVARFYTFAISLLEDVTTNRPETGDKEAMIRFLSELREMLTELLQLGDEIVSHLQAK